MTGRVAIVTGSASGLGEAATRRLRDNGWTVAAVDLPGDKLNAVAADSGAVAFPCDVTNTGAVTRTAADVHSRLGAVSRLVNAAGIAVPRRAEDVAVEDYSRSMNVNYLGTVRWVQAVLPHMRERGEGDLILFASFAGHMPTPSMAAYTSTKFAVVGFAETLAMEVRGSGVRVRCVCPPAVATPMLDGIYAHQSASAFQKLVKPISVEGVLDSVDASLRRGRRSPFVFPDISTKVLWRLRRGVPGPLRFAVGTLLADNRRQLTDSRVSGRTGGTA